MINRRPRFIFSIVAVMLASCGVWWQATSMARAGETLPDPEVAVLSMDGPGGRVMLGESLEMAKKAFPQRKGARPIKAGEGACAQVGEGGWGWSSYQPQEIFETIGEGGKVTNLLRAVVLPSMESQRKLVEITLLKCDEPTGRAEGQFFTVYAWDAKPNARFLMVGKKLTQKQGVLVASVVGDQEDLKKLGYAIGDLQEVVNVMDRYGRTELVVKKGR